MTETAQSVIAFWVDEVGPKGWYKSSARLDDAIRGRFLPCWESARDTGAAPWDGSAQAALGSVILLDQFPRNMHRDMATAFATDELARSVADRAIAAGWDLETPTPERQFFYMPFQHSENLADQDRGVHLCQERLSGDTDLHARAHRACIARFGRFPFRNAALGRDTTPDEARFLAAGGYGAITAAMRAAQPRPDADAGGTVPWDQILRGDYRPGGQT
ncbi:MAG: DUF924 family protein [Pseudomonadota bacterium]